MTTYLLNKDLHKIVSDAKTKMSNFNLPLYITGKEVENRDLPSLAVIESVLMHLSSKNLLTTAINVHYTDPTADHDQDLPLEKK